MVNEYHHAKQVEGLVDASNADGLPIQWEEVDSSRKYADFLGFDAMCCAEFAEKLLKSRCNYVIIELQLYILSQKKSENVQKCRS